MEPEQNEIRSGSSVSVVIGVIVVAVLIGGAWLMRSKNQPETSATPEVSASATPTVSVSSSATPLGSPVASTVKTFSVEGSSFTFAPAQLTVTKGDTVHIIFKNTGGMHDWVIDEFNARTPRIQSGETAEVQFVADRTGQFEYYCSVGTHRAMGMKGTLTVR